GGMRRLASRKPLEPAADRESSPDRRREEGRHATPKWPRAKHESIGPNSRGRQGNPDGGEPKQYDPEDNAANSAEPSRIGGEHTALRGPSSRGQYGNRGGERLQAVGAGDRPLAKQHDLAVERLGVLFAAQLIELGAGESAQAPGSDGCKSGCNQ